MKHAIIFYMVVNLLRIPLEEITTFCDRWNVVEFALFGSVLREDFSPESDIDVLVTFSEDIGISLFDLANMQIELQEIFQRPVDILEKDALRNPYRKRSILDTATVIYAAK